MKQFFISFFGTLTGIFVSIIILGLIVAGFFAAAVSMSDKPFRLKQKSILHIKLDDILPERSSNPSFRELYKDPDGGLKKKIGLNDFLENIQKAKADSNIKGIYLDLSFIPSGIATVEEVRNALIDFKKSGKFIISYSEIYTQKAYYLASVADKIYLNPTGFMEWKGIGSQVMFYKGLLNKLEIEMQIFRHGKFKSAIEPFDLEKMSDANRKQIKAYTGSIWNHLVQGVSVARKIEMGELNRFADEILIQNADSAVKYGLVDELKFKDEIIDIFRSKLELKEKDKINFVSIEEIDKSERKSRSKAKEKIALIYAVGSIEGGQGDDNTIGSDKISKTIRDARKDSTIKAIVLRVNSPGGSALASDVIWREVVLAQKEKPVIVSMGNVAASGGYYIACAADVIVADPNTITGSIGVFGLLPNMKNFFNNKLGITIDTANTNGHSDFGSVFRPVTSFEGAVIQKSVEEIYRDFITKVGKGRKMSTDKVDSIGQGRVWSGVDAKRIGLVDELGGIEHAIALAAKRAKLEDYKLIELPKLKDPFQEFFNDWSDDSEAMVLSKEMGEYYQYYRSFKSMVNSKGVQARLPYDLIIE